METGNYYPLVSIILRSYLAENSIAIINRSFPLGARKPYRVFFSKGLRRVLNVIFPGPSPEVINRIGVIQNVQDLFQSLPAHLLIGWV